VFEHIRGLGAKALDVRALVVVGQRRVVAPAFEHVEGFGVLQILVQVVLLATGFQARGLQQAAQQGFQGGLLAGFGDQRGNDVKGGGHIQLQTRDERDAQMIGYFPRR